MTRVYGYATAVFSSRKLERATYDLVAFGFIAANDHPDHDTIATFRRRFLKEIEGLFVQVLALAREIGMLKLGTVALDGTKIHANASRGKIHPNVRAGYCYSVTNGGSCPGPNRGSITRHGPLIIGSQVRALVPPPSSRPKPSKPSSIGNRPFLRGYSTAWFGFFGL